jgi:V/A-type H+-transporting ATPase subunit E
MQNKLDQLTQKIYQEGIDKAEEEAASIRANARRQADDIIAKAKQQAEEIRKQAEEEAGQMRRNTESDLKLAGQQAVSSLKQRIRELVIAKVLDEPAQKIMADQDFLKELILEITRHWDEAGEIELQVSDKMKQQMDQAFENSLRKEINGLEIKPNRRLSQGFRIQPKDGTYQITFTDEDLKEFFRPYLNQKADQVIFS